MSIFKFLVFFVFFTTHGAVYAQGLSYFPPISDVLPTSIEEKNNPPEQRISNIKQSISLTPEQSMHWPDVEQALNELLSYRADHRRELREEAEKRRKNHSTVDPVIRLQMNARHLREISEKTDVLAEKLAMLYPLLDAQQKRKLTALIPR